MNNSQGPKRVTSPKRSQTADSLSNKSYEQPAEKRQESPRGRRPMSFASPRAFSPSRYNKLYRCPPTPPPEVQFEREKSFVLDCAAVSNISTDYSRTNPKLGSVIRPYNAQLDQSAHNYFRFSGIDRTLKRTGQFANSESIAGRVHDQFFEHGHGFRYLSLRNQFGSGHSFDEIRGHGLFLCDPKPIVNYNGPFGYRRNTPSLRLRPTIGETSF